ncbi:MAG TPA: hypothetical protein VL379_11045, partial [Pseudomonadales bacterium]|nr:hypothetical protein [Pseudomonadales bacterium]
DRTASSQRRRDARKKPCKSIEAFLRGVSQGHIVGDGASVPGADVLMEVTAALRRILHGEKSEVALQVVCGDGGKVDPVNRDIAFLWYELHEKCGWSADAVARRVSEVYGKR